jgi:hypothetical protein
MLGLVLYAVIFRNAQRPSAALTRAKDQQEANGSRQRSECPTGIGEPWEYDRDADCYFNPAPGHQHWDLGKPPAPAQRARLMAGQPTEVAAPSGAAEAAPVSPLDTEE